MIYDIIHYGITTRPLSLSPHLTLTNNLTLILKKILPPKFQVITNEASPQDKKIKAKKNRLPQH